VPRFRAAGREDKGRAYLAKGGGARPVVAARKGRREGGRERGERNGIGGGARERNAVAAGAPSLDARRRRTRRRACEA
jgi:hypothetical protein